MYGSNWFEEDIRVFILVEFYENLITDIFKSEVIFFKTILLHWYNSECSFPSQRMKCAWSWSLMVVVVKNLKDYYSRKCTLNRSNEKVLHFFHNKWHEKCSNFKVYIWFFTERDGLNGYFWLQMIEKGLLSQMCNGFLFMNAWSWKSSYFSSEWRNFTHFRGTVHMYSHGPPLQNINQKLVKPSQM